MLIKQKEVENIKLSCINLTKNNIRILNHSNQALEQLTKSCTGFWNCNFKQTTKKSVIHRFL